MDAKRRLVLTVVVITIFSSLFNTGCRVGEEDPFFSMRTRKARLTGDWTVNSYLSEIERRESGVDSVTLTTTEIIDVVDWRQYIAVVNTDREYEYRGDVFRHRYVFDENGRMNSYYHYEVYHDEYDEMTNITTVTITNVKEEINGSWNFLAGVDDYKNKERLAVVIEDQKQVTTITTQILSDDIEPGQAPPTDIKQIVSANRWENGEMSTIYRIRMLRSNQMILDQDVNTFVIKRDAEGNSFSVTETGFLTMTLDKN